MRPIRSLLVALVGWGFIAGLLYVCACLTVFVIAINLPQPVKIFPLFRYQSLYYFMGGRNIWQYDPACAQPDSELIYAPREGACHFSNLEFDTVLNFDAKGRSVPARAHADPTLPGIAVLGDSYGMGWGVDDAETFANVMQSGLTQPVFNLGVSSYGTERELKRLELSGMADGINTVVILYCNNDLGENLFLRTSADYATAARGFAEEAIAGEGMASYPGRWAYLKELLLEVLLPPLTVPLQRMWAHLQSRYGETEPQEAVYRSSRDFTPHLDALRETLLRYQSLLAGKQVYVAYVLAGGTRFDNYPIGVDAELPNVTFVEPPLGPEDFFVLDDHLSAVGHRHLGEWLLTALYKQPSGQP